MISVSKASSFRAWAAPFLCAAALAAAPAALSGDAGDTGEIPDEKGRTPSWIAAEQRREQALAGQFETRKAQAVAARRRAIAVPSDANECLAYHRSERRCLVTVGEFNRRLEDDGQWVERGGDSAIQDARILDIRKRLLASLLEERYADALIDGESETAIQAGEAWRAHLAGMEASLGEDKLRALYRKHAAAFGPRREVQAEFLGASDSSFLDSLVQCMSEPLPAALPGKQAPAGKGCGSGRLYLWGKLQTGDLPETLPRVTGTLRQGEISGIIRGRFGWFVIAAARVVDIPAKTYEESRPLLAHLAGLPEGPGGTGDAGGGQAALAGQGAQETGSARGENFAVRRGENPALRVWLLPRAASGKGKRLHAAAWSDTGLVSALRLRLSDLPAGVGCEAAAHLRRSGGGISHTRFGTWFFRAEENPTLARVGKERVGKEEPCGAETGTPPSQPDPLSKAAGYLASKEKDFKRNILEAQPRAPGAAGSGPRDDASLRTKWITENVTLANNVLKRF